MNTIVEDPTEIHHSTGRCLTKRSPLSGQTVGICSGMMEMEMPTAHPE
jgi:hypothetical protein